MMLNNMFTYVVVVVFERVNSMDKFCNEAYYRFFNALANRTRLAMIDALKDEPKKGAEIAEALDQEPEAVNQYLELMAGCMLLHSEGVGSEKRYSLNREILEPLSEMLSFHASKYCPGLKRCIPGEKLKEYKKREAAKDMFIEH
jgi:DNA-binding transcriptional ArsR family regulator